MIHFVQIKDLANGNNTLVAAGKPILVLQLFLYSPEDAVVTFKSGSDAITPDFSLLTASGGVNAGFTLQHSPVGWFKTASGEALVLASDSTEVTGLLVYRRAD